MKPSPRLKTGVLLLGLLVVSCLAATHFVFRSPDRHARETVQTRPPLDAPREYLVVANNTKCLTTLVVMFRRVPTSQQDGARILRQAMDEAVGKNDAKEILALGFAGDDDPLPYVEYGGPLVYSPKERKIETLAETRGRRVAHPNASSHFTSIAESIFHDASGAVAQRSLECGITFSNLPSATEFKSAALSEIENLMTRNLDIRVYAYIGDRNDAAASTQVPGPNGKFLCVVYDHRSGAITSNFD